jgi:hypothetical protein
VIAAAIIRLPKNMLILNAPCAAFVQSVVRVVYAKYFKEKPPPVFDVVLGCNDSRNVVLAKGQCVVGGSDVTLR